MDAYKFLDSHSISYARFDHPAVFTSKEAIRLVPRMPGLRTKNLFLRDRRGRRHFLVIVAADIQVDLKTLSEVLECSRLSFGSAERLGRVLGIKPGSVSFLSIINDLNGLVEVVFDVNVWRNAYLQCHPLINTSTLLFSHDAVERILELTGHRHRAIAVPTAS